jgi:hypothetical protein
MFRPIEFSGSRGLRSSLRSGVRLYLALQRLGARLGIDSVMDPVNITTAKTVIAKSNT